MKIDHVFTADDFKKVTRNHGYNYGEYEGRLLGVKEEDGVITFDVKIIYWDNLRSYCLDFDSYNEALEKIFSSMKEATNFMEKTIKEGYGIYNEVDCTVSTTKENLIKNFTKYDGIEFGRFAPIESYSYKFVKSWIGTLDDTDSSKFYTKYAYLGEDFIQIIKDIVTKTAFETLYDEKYGSSPLRPSDGWCALEFTDACVNSLNLSELSDKMRAE